MLIQVRVKPNSSKNTITKLQNNIYKVAVEEPAKDGKANKAVLELVARKFDKSAKIISGHKSNKKTISLK